MDDEAQQQEQFRAWVKAQFEGMGRHAADHQLIQGEKAEGRPMWAVPGKLFIGKIWNAADEDNAWWVISGAVPTDHIAADVAATPRDALRHLCLKWQMQSARLEQAEDPADQQAWTGIGENLASQAEALYPLVEEDSLWEVADDD